MTLIYNFSHLGFCMSMDILRSTPHPRYLQNISYKASIVTIAEVNRFRFWANPQIWLSICYAAAKLIQSCPTLCDPIDGSPPGSPVPGILQARTLEWVAISFSNAWKWSRSVMSDSSRPHGLQPTRLLCPWDCPGKSTKVGCHCLLQASAIDALL